MMDQAGFEKVMSSNGWRMAKFAVQTTMVILILIGFSLAVGDAAKRKNGLKFLSEIADTAQLEFYGGLDLLAKQKTAPKAGDVFITASIIDDFNMYQTYHHQASWMDLRHIFALTGLVASACCVVLTGLYAYVHISSTQWQWERALHTLLHTGMHITVLVVTMFVLVTWSERNVTNTLVARTYQDDSAAFKDYLTSSGPAAAAKSIRFHTGAMRAADTPAATTSGYWHDDISQVLNEEREGFMPLFVAIFFFSVIGKSVVLHLGLDTVVDSIAFASGNGPKVAAAINADAVQVTEFSGTSDNSSSGSRGYTRFRRNNHMA